MAELSSALSSCSIVEMLGTLALYLSSICTHLAHSMGLFTRLAEFSKQNGKQFQPTATAQTLTAPPASSSIQPQQPKTLSELERELEQSMASPVIQVHPHRSAHPVSRSRLLTKLFWVGLLAGIPVGALWLVNLPYPPIRRPVARVAPILLLPSYMNIDENYRDAIALVKQAEQLVNQATSHADIELGEQKMIQAQESLDALPIWFLYDFPEYRSWWYYWRFSPSQFDNARARMGELEAKVFQEKNARILSVEAEQALAQGKQQYQQAKTPTDKQLAIDGWRSALDQLEQIPAATFAGRTAQQQFIAAQREFQETVGLAAGNEEVASIIEAAKGLAWEAAKLGQNPPHSVEEWQQVENLWQEAIARVERIPSSDMAGYREAQRLSATYRSSVAQIRIRKQAEADATQALRAAQSQIQNLQSSISDNAENLNRNYTVSQLQGIINQLQRIENGTTAYLEAQQLLVFAKNKLNQLQP